MTIKEFAGLCGCNPQTLRYYDSVGLLKPARAPILRRGAGPVLRKDQKPPEGGLYH